MAGTYLVSLPLGPGAGPRVNKVDSVLVYAGSSTDALTIAKNQFNFNVDALWAAATVQAMDTAGVDMTGWNLRIKVASPTGVVKVDQTVNSGSEAAIAAQGTLTFTGAPTAADTVHINGILFTFVSPVGVTAGNVLFTTEANAQTNLIAAINGAAGAGTTYVAASGDPGVTAVQGAGNTVVLTAKKAGFAGNAITTTSSITGPNGSFDAATLGTTTAGTNGPSVDGLGQIMADLINTNYAAIIDGAAYNTSTHTLTVADIGDNLGDHTLTAYMYPPNGSRDSVVSFISTIVNGGVAGAVLTVVLVAANTVPGPIVACQVNPFY